MSVAYSVVIPAYNEETRLPVFLPSVFEYMKSEFPGAFEVLVIDDGSTDGTAAWLASQIEPHPELRVVSFSENRGKGAAVRAGVLAASGDSILFCDADGATPIAEELRLRAAIKERADVAVGSRLVVENNVLVRRSRGRRLAARMFAAAAGWLLRPPARDTQCGFKMFRGDVGRRLAALATEDGYLFDLEWLCLARREGFTVAEIPVNWSEKPGSKLRVAHDGLRVLSSLWRLHRRLHRSAGEGEGS